MADQQPISVWIERVKQGDEDAATRIWQLYFPELVQIARNRLQAAPRRTEDEEDIALAALDSFFRAAHRGRFPDLADRQGLWRLLAAITQRKAVDLIRRSLARKAGGGAVRGESVFAQGAGLAQLAEDRLSPCLAAMIADQIRQLLDDLQDTELRAMALAKFEGFSNDEISQQLDCSVRTVERRLQLIRTKWQQTASAGADP